MEQPIINNYTKIDLHIHSFASSPVDKGKVKNNTEDKIETTLLPLLNKNEVNMVAIADHNTFSYRMYSKLKSFEGTGFLQKVLPGVEINLDFMGKDIHTIFIFDDSDDQKVSNIDAVLQKHGKTSGDSLIFEKSSIQKILEEIDLKVVIIVHQKCSIEAGKQDSNLAQIGPDLFDKVISADYFDSVEFKSLKVEGFLTNRMGQTNSNFKYLSGSDCHNWDVYPNYLTLGDSPMNFTYIKSLPTFKGLVMAITGDNRISLANIPLKGPYLKSINFSINGKTQVLPLSSGLNVIIGDNSVGKSLLLYGILDPTFKNADKKRGDGYLKFCKSKNFIIEKATLAENSYRFDKQGEIRQKFESNGESIQDVPFIKKHFKTLETMTIISEITNVIDDFLEYEELLDTKNEAEEALNSSLSIKCDLSKTTYRLLATNQIGVFDNTNYQSLKIYLFAAKNNLSLALSNCLNEIENDDVITIKSTIKQIEIMLIKYQWLERNVYYTNSLYSETTTIFSDFADEVEKAATTLDKEIGSYKEETEAFVKKIVEYFGSCETFQRRGIILPEFIACSNIDNPVDKYKFRSSFAINAILKSNLEEMLCFPVKYAADFDKLKVLGLSKILGSVSIATANLVGTPDASSKKEAYKASCIDFAKKKWLMTSYTILDKNDDVSSNNSPGKNALYYLDIYSCSSGEKLYIVDQPEDDVSEHRISKELIKTLRQMMSQRQVLFVTHSPELVVNLDVDNVIVMKQKIDKQLSVFNGALEFESQDVNILHEVATLLDGGAETIQRRWKRYAKGNK